MIETEVKININKAKFCDLIVRFKNPKFIKQKNTYYRGFGKDIRLREENGKIFLNSKRSCKGDFNSRIEGEFEINSDILKVEEFLELIEMKKFLSYEKQRASILFNGCVVSLDILPSQDYYIEIEGNSENIKRTLRELDLFDCNVEKRSYLEILNNLQFKWHV